MPKPRASSCATPALQRGCRIAWQRSRRSTRPASSPAASSGRPTASITTQRPAFARGLAAQGCNRSPRHPAEECLRHHLGGLLRRRRSRRPSSARLAPGGTADIIAETAEGASIASTRISFSSGSTTAEALFAIPAAAPQPRRPLPDRRLALGRRRLAVGRHGPPPARRPRRYARRSPAAPLRALLCPQGAAALRPADREEALRPARLSDRRHHHGRSRHDR